MPQNQKKEKTPLHLRLTYEDWKNCFKDLTRGELGVLLAIRCLDPYGDRTLEIDCGRLGEELDLHRTSVSRALESLSQKGLIQMEITKVKVKQKVRNRKLTLLQPNQSEPDGGENKSNHELKGEQESCAPTHTEVRPRTQKCAHAHRSAPTHTEVRPRTNQHPEPAPSKDSSAPQTYSDFTDFLQTLSEGERAGFQDFCRKETDNYPRPIINLGDYLASRDSNGQPRYLDFWERFRAGAAPRAGAADAEQAWKEAIAYAARYNRYDEGTWLKSLPISPEMKNAIGACGGLMRLGEANSSELFTLKSTFKQAFRQPNQLNQSINHQEKTYAVPALR